MINWISTIIVVSAVVALMRIGFVKRLPTKLRLWVCPICVGVVTAWVGLLVVRQLGRTVDPVALGMLMGGSVVGLALQLEKAGVVTGGALLWKILFIVSGLGAVYFAVYEQWIFAAAIAGCMAVLTGAWWWLNNQRDRTNQATVEHPRVSELEQRMKDCC